MLRVDIRINLETVGTVEVLRDKTDRGETLGNYTVTLETGGASRPLVARVEGFRRRRGAIALLAESLRALGYKAG